MKWYFSTIKTLVLLASLQSFIFFGDFMDKLPPLNLGAKFPFDELVLSPPIQKSVAERAQVESLRKIGHIASSRFEVPVPAAPAAAAAATAEFEDSLSALFGARVGVRDFLDERALCPPTPRRGFTEKRTDDGRWSLVRKEVAREEEGSVLKRSKPNA